MIMHQSRLGARRGHNNAVSDPAPGLFGPGSVFLLEVGQVQGDPGEVSPGAAVRPTLRSAAFHQSTVDLSC